MLKQLFATAAIAACCYSPAISAENTYDYDFKATVFADGQFYGTRRGNEDGKRILNSYYTVLADKALSEEGEPQPGGTYYAFDIYGAAPLNMDKILPPDGTYNLAAVPAMNVLLNRSMVYVLDGNGNYEVERTFTSGNLVISTTEKDGNSYINYDATLVDEKGYTHHVTYSSRFVSYVDQSQGPGYLEKDLDVKATWGKGRFMELSENGVMEMTFTFSDFPLNEEGDIEMSGLPNTSIILQAYLDYTADGIANGVYDITTEYGAAGTMADGEIVQISGVEYPVGSYAEYITSDQGVHWGVFKSGKLTVSGSGDERTYVAEFVTKEGFNVKFTYTGALKLSKMPETTLTQNVTLDLKDAKCVAHYFGDTYREQGATWLIDFISADGKGDSWMSELVSPKQYFWNGIQTATYTAAPNNNLWKRDYKRGQRIDGNLVGTWYRGDFDSEGIPHILAPAVEGDLNIENHGDGTYTFRFCFQDGMNHTWSGEWTGKPEMINMTDEPDENGVSEMASDDLSITVDPVAMTVNFSADADFTLIDFAGKTVACGHGDTVNVPGAGFYILRAGGKTVKVVF